MHSYIHTVTLLWLANDSIDKNALRPRARAGSSKYQFTFKSVEKSRTRRTIFGNVCTATISSTLPPPPPPPPPTTMTTLTTNRNGVGTWSTYIFNTMFVYIELEFCIYSFIHSFAFNRNPFTLAQLARTHSRAPFELICNFYCTGPEPKRSSIHRNWLKLHEIPNFARCTLCNGVDNIEEKKTIRYDLMWMSERVSECVCVFDINSAPSIPAAAVAAKGMYFSTHFSLFLSVRPVCLFLLRSIVCTPIV